MRPSEVLRDLQKAGFRLVAEAGRVVVTPASKLKEQERDLIRRHRDDLLALLTVASPTPLEAPRRAANDEGRPHVPPDARKASRLARMGALGFNEERAEWTAERLQMRDAEEDDRRICIECSHLTERGRCLAAAAGRIKGTDRHHEPVLDLLHRCEGFGLRKGMQ